ncbi:MAG: GCN5-related N-acetyltransferase [Verrucomicrobia bacterium]|nr:GCN5-related N-acetyltransferase [Verrucomicrobiota bacterium]
MKILFSPIEAAAWPAVKAIYQEGIATGHATFAGTAPDNFADFCDGKLMDVSIVASDGTNGTVLGWATLSAVSDRCVYAGVAEVSVYVANAVRGQGIGEALMKELILRSEAAGTWTLQAGIFPENAASLRLHAKHGFRTLGVREKVGKMTHGPRAGEWRDTVLLERRSKVTGV